MSQDGSDVYAKVVLSTDTKPEGAFAGQLIIESDTHNVFEWSGSMWTQIGTAGSSGDFFFDIAEGKRPGYSIAQITGRNPAVGTLFEDIWDGGALALLNYDAETAPFTNGLVLTGGTSGGTATIANVVDNGTTGVLCLRNIVGGPFQNNETITDSGTGSATSDGVVVPIRGESYPIAGEQWFLVCESADDDIAGTGARTVQVVFMEEATGLYIAETVNTGGHTPVALDSDDGFRFRSAAVTSWGSATNSIYGKTNLGTISIINAAGDLRGAILYDDSISGDEHGLNNSMDSHFTIENGKTGYPIFLSTNTTKNHDVTMRAVTRLTGTDGFSTTGEMSNYQNSFIEDISKIAAGVPELTDIKIIGRSNNTAVNVNVQLGIIMVNNGTP